ncbi:hypothetical protein OG215_36370 (plasmid) [Streptomyces globisporus]|uniref:hypothetical protein n=1 Tax=Streptomyces globisporus TaxID=1908 RepID=UPI002F91BAD5|nr:hypothetical protein OG215_36370 [Streptomyces globisporus]
MPHRRNTVEVPELLLFGDAFTPAMGRADVRPLLKEPWEEPPLSSNLLLVFGPPVATTSATSRTP